jgi:hypothetical protein
MISDSLVSFVVQGPVITGGEFSTLNVLNSIRKHFPGAEIILSTWKDSPLEGLQYDKVLLLDVPPTIQVIEGYQSNINRLIYSSYEGIKASTRKYTVKTRTNTLFSNNSILSTFKEELTNSVFTKKIYTIEYFTRDSYKCSVIKYNDGYLFHPSDIFLFGLKEDVQEFFSCPHATTEIMMNKRDRGLPIHTEQYIWMNLLIRRKKLKNYRHAVVKYNPWHCYLSEKTLFDNFKVFDHTDIGLVLEPRLTHGWMYECIIKGDFQRKYDNKTALGKSVLLWSRAIYYTLIYNRFFREVFGKKVSLPHN